MKKHLIIIDGPVSVSSFKNVKWSTPVDFLAINHGIANDGSNCSSPSNKYYNQPPCIGSGAFSNLGNSYPKDNILSRIVSASGLSIKDYSRVCIAGFSAAHGLNEIIAQDKSSRENLTCLYAMDSYYIGGSPGLKKGYYEFGLLAKSDYSKAFILTTSDFAGPASMPYLSGTDSIDPLLSKLNISTEKQIGKLYRSGNCLYTNYGTTISHAEHAVKIGPMNMEKIISPWMTELDGGSSPIKQELLYLPSKSKYLVGAIVGISILALIGGGYYITKTMNEMESQ
jgi:hypothetical protein